jgi:hypothetical protein
MNSLYGFQQINLLAFLTQISECLSEERNLTKKIVKRRYKMVYIQEFLLRFDTVTEFIELRYVKFYILRFYLCAHEEIKILLWAEILWPTEYSQHRHTLFM